MPLDKRSVAIVALLAVLIALAAVKLMPVAFASAAMQSSDTDPALGGGDEPAPVPPSSRPEKAGRGLGHVMQNMDAETRAIVLDPKNADKEIVLVRKGDKYVVKSVTEPKTSSVVDEGAE